MALRRGEILAFALLAVASIGAAAPAGGERDTTAQARRILEDGHYQTSLPVDPLPPTTLDWDLGPFAQLVRVLLWIALGVVVVLAAVWIVNRLGGRTRDEGVEDGAGAPAPLEVPLENAERLAAAGRFAEAIHVLLLETVAALSRAARLAPSLTSREIVARVPLPARAREALAGLVLAVEVSRFGGEPAGERDYRACLDRFHAFIDTYRRAADVSRRGAQRAEGAPA